MENVWSLLLAAAILLFMVRLVVRCLITDYFDAKEAFVERLVENRRGWNDGEAA